MSAMFKNYLELFLHLIPAEPYLLYPIFFCVFFLILLFIRFIIMLFLHFQLEVYLIVFVSSLLFYFFSLFVVMFIPVLEEKLKQISYLLIVVCIVGSIVYLVQHKVKMRKS